jgi:hypothetical protein
MAAKTYHLPKTTVLSISTVLGSYPIYSGLWEYYKDVLQKHLEQIRNAVRLALTAAIISMLFMTTTTHSLDVVNHSAPVTNNAIAPQVVSQPISNAFALKGINMGNDQSSTWGLPYQSVQNANDLAYLKGKVSRIRIALAYGLDANDVRNLKTLAIEAKQRGFYVQFGITAGSDASVTTYYNQWLSRDIVATAAWAQANHIDEFAIGNEEDWYNEVLGAYTTKTPREVRDDIRNIVPEVRKVYSGSIVFADAEGTIDDWIQEGIGGLDRIYFNVYDTLPNFQAIISKIASNFGTKHGGIAEWSAEHGYNEMIWGGMSPQQYAQEIMNRAAIVKSSGLPAYLFTLRTNPGSSDWGFILRNGTKQPGLDEFLAS